MSRRNRFSTEIYIPSPPPQKYYDPHELTSQNSTLERREQVGKGMNPTLTSKTGRPKKAHETTISPDQKNQPPRYRVVRGNKSSRSRTLPHKPFNSTKTKSTPTPNPKSNPKSKPKPNQKSNPQSVRVASKKVYNAPMPTRVVISILSKSDSIVKMSAKSDSLRSTQPIGPPLPDTLSLIVPPISPISPTTPPDNTIISPISPTSPSDNSTVISQSNEVLVPAPRKRLLSRSDPGYGLTLGRLSPNANVFTPKSKLNVTGITSSRTSPGTLPKAGGLTDITEFKMQAHRDHSITTSDVVFFPALPSLEETSDWDWYLARVTSAISRRDYSISFPVRPGSPIMKQAYSNILAALWLEEKYPNHVSYSVSPIQQANSTGLLKQQLRDHYKKEVNFQKTGYNPESVAKFLELMMWPLNPGSCYDDFFQGFSLLHTKEIKNSYSVLSLFELEI